MEGGSLAPDFSLDGSGLPAKTDSPDGNLRHTVNEVLEYEQA